MQQIHSHTALRGIAAMMVVYGHYTDVFARDIAGMNFFIPRTYLGVDLFFLLSGFILYWVYDSVFVTQVGLLRWLSFLQRRLARIYPLHLATLLMVIALMRFDIPAQDLGLLWQNIGLVHAWGFADRFIFNAPSWSISCEFAAYLVFPFLMLLIRSRVGLAMLLGIFVCSYAVLWQLGGGALDLDAIGRGFAILRVAGAFPAGMILAHLYRNTPALGPRAQTALQLVSLAAFCGGVAFGVADIMLIPVLAVLVFALASPHGLLSTVLGIKPLRWLGDVSYGIYLIQWPLMLFMFNLRPKMQPYLTGGALELAALVIFLALLFGLSFLSFRYFERPIAQKARRPSFGLEPHKS